MSDRDDVPDPAALDELLSDDASPAERWAVQVNKLLLVGLQAGIDRETMTTVFINSARELWDFYGVHDSHDTEASNFQEFVALAGFETADVEDALDRAHNRAPGEWERRRGTDHYPDDESEGDADA